MKALLGLILLLCLIVGTTGFFSVIVPIKRLGIKSRVMGGWIFLASLVTIATCIAVGGTDNSAPSPAPTQAPRPEEKSIPPEPVKSAPTCASDWTACTDNADFVNHSGKWSYIGAACELATAQKVLYGDPKWPYWTQGGSFGMFMGGDGYVKNHIAIAIEQNAQIQNQFGAMMHAQVYCGYDIIKQAVIDVDILPK